MKYTENASIVVQWDAVDDFLFTIYTVNWYSRRDQVQAVAVAEQVHTITGLTLDTVYTITVSAANMCGDGPESNTSVSLSTDTTSTTRISASTNTVPTVNPSNTTTATVDTSSNTNTTMNTPIITTTDSVTSTKTTTVKTTMTRISPSTTTATTADETSKLSSTVNWGEPERAPHKCEVHAVGLSVCLSVCPYVHNTKIYKSSTNLRVPSLASVVDCSI